MHLMRLLPAREEMERKRRGKSISKEEVEVSPKTVDPEGAK
jgi:hypothetical protein